MPHTAETRRLAGSKGGNTRSARYDRDELTRAARNGFEDSFLRAVDPDGILDSAERQRRAHAAMRAHMADLALKSVAARRARKSA